MSFVFMLFIVFKSIIHCVLVFCSLCLLYVVHCVLHIWVFNFFFQKYSLYFSLLFIVSFVCHPLCLTQLGFQLFFQKYSLCFSLLFIVSLVCRPLCFTRLLIVFYTLYLIGVHCVLHPIVSYTSGF